MGNQLPFMNKTLPNAFMSRSKQRNLFFRNRTKEYRNTYVKQKKLYVIHFCKRVKESFWGV